MKKLIIILLAVTTLSACKESQKIAFIDSTELMQDYKAVKELEKEIEKKQIDLQNKFQQIALEYDKEEKEFQNKVKKMSRKKADARYQELMYKQQQINQGYQAENANLQKESQEKMDKIIEDVKDFVADYAKKNGYSYVLGSNDSGNVMYGDSQHDLTEQLLVSINKKYKEGGEEVTEEESVEEEEPKTEESEESEEIEK